MASNPPSLTHPIPRALTWLAQTLRKDVKRLRSDLNDSANDASSYEGIFSNSVGPPGAGATAGGDGDDSAGSKPDGDEEQAAKKSAEWTSPGDGVADLPMEMPPGKRQKSEEVGGGDDGEARTAAVANGIASLVTPPGTGGGADNKEIARMGEKELREQLEIQSRLVTEMMKEIALLKKHTGRNAGGTLDAPAGAVSALPVRWYTRRIARLVCAVGPPRCR